MSKRILVTGGFGFLGAAIANKLADEGNRVTLLDDASRGNLRRLVEPERFAIKNADVRTARFGTMFDSVWHLAAVNGTVNFYKDPYRVLDVQLAGTLNVVAQCRDWDVPELVLFSSSEVYHQAATVPTDETTALVVPDVLNPRYSYAGSKIASELIALHSKINRVLVLRPHNVYGPDMGYDHVIPQFFMRMRAGKPFEIKGDPGDSRAFIHVDDFAAGALMAWRFGERRGIYHVGTEDEVTMAELAREIAELTAASAVGFTQVEGHEGGPRRRCPDTSKMTRLGWKPLIKRFHGLADVRDWMYRHADEWPKEAA